jgi:putative flippase GtrA
VPSARTIVELIRSHHGRKALRYSMVSVVAVVVSQGTLWICHGLLGWGPIVANVVAVFVGAIPSYLLNRAWVWGRRGSHDWLREVVPFWVFAFIGLCLSILFVAGAARWSEATAVVSLANLSAFGILWIGRYLVLDQLLFRALDRVDDEEQSQLPR